jgi:hypothetical protein
MHGFRRYSAILVTVVMSTLLFSTGAFAQSEFEYGQMMTSLMVNRKQPIGLIAITLSLGSEERVEKSLILSKDTINDIEKSFREMIKDLTGEANASIGDDMVIYNYLGRQGWEIIHVERSSPNDTKMADELIKLLAKLAGEKMPFNLKDFNIYANTILLKRRVDE